MSLFNSLKHLLGGKSPANAAIPYVNQISPMAQQQLNPYIQQGQMAGNAAQGTYGQMAQNPRSIYDEIISGYTPSKGYQFRQEQGQKALTNAASAGGYRGTQNDQIAQAELLNKLLGQDQQEYLQNVLGIQSTGLQGQEFGAQRGFQANNNLTDILGSSLSTQGELAFQQQADKNKRKNDAMKFIFQLLGGAAGGAIGGIGGAQIGSSLGGSLAGSGGGNAGGSYPSNAKNQMYGGGSF